MAVQWCSTLRNGMREGSGPTLRSGEPSCLHCTFLHSCLEHFCRVNAVTLPSVVEGLSSNTRRWLQGPT